MSHHPPRAFILSIVLALGVVSTLFLCTAKSQALASGTSPFILTRSLEIGSRGKDVSALQAFLKGEGYFTYPTITGYFGSFTEQAVILFQKSNAIDPIGIVGPKTRAKLLVYSGESSSANSAGTVVAVTPTTTSSLQAKLNALLAELQALEVQAVITPASNTSPSPAVVYATAGGVSVVTGGGSAPAPDTNAPSVSSFSASSSIVAVAETSTLSWNITNASSVAITPGNFSTSTLVGSTTVNPTSTTIYTITATNVNGTSTATTSVSVATAPATPGSFSVGSPTTSTLALSWASSTPNNGATIAFYAIYRGTSTSTMPQVATTSNGTYTDTNLATSTTYFYYVTAQDSVGNISASSSIASSTTTTLLPCDALAAAGTPCIAAHSITRKLLEAYSGNLFQLGRFSDSSTLNVGTLASGVANTSGIGAFCAGTQCYYKEIYDQMGTPSVGNNLSQATAADAAPLSFVTISGASLPMLATVGKWYRNRTSTVNMPTGNAATTEYMVVGTADYSGCCGTYGNVETTVADPGASHMFELSWSSVDSGSMATGTAPWAGTDMENGVFSYGSTNSQNYLTILSKHDPSGTALVMKSGAPGSPLATLYSGALHAGYDPLHQEGGLSLGEGGDGSISPTDYLEGAVTAAATTDLTDAAVQASVSSFYSGATAFPNANGVLNPLYMNQAPWTFFGGGAAQSVTATTDPLSGSNAYSYAGNSGYLNAIHQPFGLTSSAPYTFSVYIKATTGVTVFPSGSVATQGGHEWAWVLNTNNGTAVVGTWGNVAPTSVSTTASGAWWILKMQFTTAAIDGGTGMLYLAPPNANGSGVRSTSDGSAVIYYNPTLVVGTH